MKITFLGTNGWYDTATGATVSTLVETERLDVILDAGYGLARGDRHLSGKKPALLLLSHFHLDHVVGLHALVKLPFPRLTIAGQPGTRGVLGALAAEPFTIPLERLPYPCDVVELAEGRHEEPAPLECRPLVHASPCYGYRLRLDGRTVAYCTDTGPCEGALALARGADLLISECALAPGHENRAWPHQNPESAALLAREAGAARLVLTHFDALEYPDLELRREAERIARAVFPETVAAVDGMQVEL